jgi:hypothetical protein
MSGAPNISELDSVFDYIVKEGALAHQ